MIVTGLNQDLYYINNPIKVEISDFQSDLVYGVKVTLQNSNWGSGSLAISNTIELYINPITRILIFDLSEIIKGNFTEPTQSETYVSGQPIPDNHCFFRVIIGELLVQGSGLNPQQLWFERTFIRGGVETRNVNQTASVGDTLIDSPKILVWGGFPVRKYYIGIDKRIYNTTTFSTLETQQMKLLGCDGLYIRFLNTKGGYANWYFPVWEQSKKTKGAKGYVKRSFRNSLFLGKTDLFEITAESRVVREHYPTVKSLIASPDVAVYNLYGSDWTQVDVSDTTFKENNYEDIQDLTVKFELDLSLNENVIW